MAAVHHLCQALVPSVAKSPVPQRRRLRRAYHVADVASLLDDVDTVRLLCLEYDLPVVQDLAPRAVEHHLGALANGAANREEVDRHSRHVLNALQCDQLLPAWRLAE